MNRDDIERLRREWPIDDTHKATRNANHCDVCHQRMPCDWAQVISDLHGVLDELERMVEGEVISLPMGKRPRYVARGVPR